MSKKFFLLKLDSCLSQVNMKIVRIHYNECYTGEANKWEASIEGNVKHERSSMKRASLSVSFKVFVYCFSAIVYMELFINIMYMLAHGAMTDIETIGNFFIQ